MEEEEEEDEQPAEDVQPWAQELPVQEEVKEEMPVVHQWYGLSKVSNSPIRASTSFADKRLLPFTAALQDIDATFSVFLLFSFQGTDEPI